MVKVRAWEPLARYSQPITIPFLLQQLSLLIGIVALALLVYSAVFVSRPGPSEYYSHFPCLYLSSCLLFEVVQFLLLEAGRTQVFYSKWTLGFSWTYWVIIALSGFICGVGYAIVAKPDCVAVGFLSSFVGMAGIACLMLRYRGLETRNRALETPNDTKRPARGSRFCFGFLKWFNRFLKFVHWCFAILFVAGAIISPLQYRYSNPGTSIKIHLPSGQTRSLNYNCTTVPSNNTDPLPTFWFEADAAHGIVDFLGMQHYLAVVHGRNSCSYDPPNFGWSEALPSSLDNWFTYFIPLLEALGQQGEDRVIVAWGAGAENALEHTVEDPARTKALVILDASPEGIEWLDAQRANNWTEKQMLDYRMNDLTGRIFLAETILALGVPWGLMPILVPSNSTSYFDPTLYSRFVAQSTKEPMWTYQYYELLQEASRPISTYLTSTMVPPSVRTYAIITNNSQPLDAASSAFYRKTKLDMVEHIAGDRNVSGLVWCDTEDCNLGFPVDKAEWTANAIISFGL